jgi:DNA-binding transcriptional MocR family regulator
MTIWTPDLIDRSGPKYRAIADALAEDVGNGVLAEGARLPTHRDLAWQLGVTVGTVSRAYALAQERGLIAGEVGRGTIVRATASSHMATAVTDLTDRPGPAPFFASPLGGPSGAGVIEMGRNYPTDAETAEAIARAMRRMAAPKLLAELGAYQPPNGLPAHREAAASWMSGLGVDADTRTTLIANGCQNALAIAMSAISRPGDRVLVEELTWPGIAQLSTSLGLTVETVALDEEGLRPDSLEAACRQAKIGLLYTVPTLQNPTTTTMSEMRRREIVEIARRYDVILLEDGIFGFLSPDAPPPIQAMAPDITIYATGLSKAVSPSLRIGYLAAPEHLVSPLATAVKATMLMPATLGAHLAAELIFSGDAGRAAERQRRQASARQRLARQILGRNAGLTNSDASQVWMDLPDQWTARQFAEAAMARGISINPGYSFMPAPAGEGPPNIRICLAAEGSDQRIEDGLHIIADLLASHPPEPAAIV